MIILSEVKKGIGHFVYIHKKMFFSKNSALSVKSSELNPLSLSQAHKNKATLQKDYDKVFPD